MGAMYPIPMLGGVNLRTAASALGESELTRSKNMAPMNHKRMSKRYGVKYLGGNETTGYPIAGIISPHPNFGDVLFLLRGSSGIEGLSISSVETGTTTPTLTVEALDFYSARPWMFSFGKSAIVLSGPDAIPAAGRPVVTPPTGIQVTASGNSYTVANFSLAGTNNSLLRPKVASPYKQRIVYANFGPGYENTLVFTDNGSATTVGNDVLAANGRNVSLVSAQDGDEIVALIEVMLVNQGSPAASALLVLRRFGNPFLLTGEPDQTTGGTNTLDPKRISVNAGCAGPYTVARTPYGIVWAGQDDVWCFEYGVVRNIGLNIQSALLASPPDQQIYWSGAYHNGFYRLAIWGEGQDFTYPNAPSDQWWLDLDSGLPKDWQSAQWFGPQQILTAAVSGTSAIARTRVMVSENRAGKKPCLFGVESGVVSGASTRHVVLIEYDAQLGRDLASNPEVLAPYLTQGCEIEGLIVSREMGAESNYLKATDGIQATVRPDHDVELTLAIIPDAGEDKQEVSKQLNPGGFRTNASILGTDRIGEGKPVGFSIYAEPGDRPLGTTFQYELGDNAGHVIVEGYNDCLYIVVQDVPNSISYQVVATIAAGRYTISALATAVVNAYNAVKLFGNNWSASFSSGVLNLAGGGPYATSVDISIRFSAFAAEVGTAPTSAQLAACRRLAAILGFDTNNTPSDRGLTPLLIGDEAPYINGVAHYELWGLQANIEVFPRDP